MVARTSEVTGGSPLWGHHAPAWLCGSGGKLVQENLAHESNCGGMGINHERSARRSNLVPRDVSPSVRRRARFYGDDEKYSWDTQAEANV
jgi:hypothetical protein